jgi:hypothetical protein
MNVDEEFENGINELHARIDLTNEHCHLKHSKEDPAENHPAVDFLCQNLGYENFVTETIRIPICQECVEALLSEEWILFYCVGCNNSQWLNRKYAKHPYPFWLHVHWMDTCPVCHKMEQEISDDHD